MNWAKLFLGGTPPRGRVLLFIELYGEKIGNPFECARLVKYVHLLRIMNSCRIRAIV